MKIMLKIFNYIFVFTSIVFLLSTSTAQNLEVVGKAKISIMDNDNTSEQVVVRQPDGMLAVQELSVLNAPNVGNYGTVVNQVTGRVWLDRNLGASQVADSMTHEESYGDLYQWGRAADGHQLRNSSNSQTQATTWLADEGSNTWDGKFINSEAWLTTAAEGLWSGTAAENNPCPSGFRIPTAAEWKQEMLTWETNDAAGAFSSTLKLSLAGFRETLFGNIVATGDFGFYWSSTAKGSQSIAIAISDELQEILLSEDNRTNGFSIRCIMD